MYRALRATYQEKQNTSYGSLKIYGDYCSVQFTISNTTSLKIGRSGSCPCSIISKGGRIRYLISDIIQSVPLFVTPEQSLVMLTVPERVEFFK